MHSGRTCPYDCCMYDVNGGRSNIAWIGKWISLDDSWGAHAFGDDLPLRISAIEQNQKCNAHQNQSYAIENHESQTGCSQGGMAGIHAEIQPAFTHNPNPLLYQDDCKQGALFLRSPDHRGVGGVPHQEQDAEACHGSSSGYALQLEGWRKRSRIEHELHGSLHVPE